MQPLYDLNLQLLEDVHVVGNWRVVARRVNHADPATALVSAGRLRFEAPNRLVLQPEPTEATRTASAEQPDPTDAVISTTATGPGEVGSWTLQRDQLLSRPYIKLRLPDGETRALITRMRRSRDGADCEMLLYFQTGLEVELQCA